MNVTSELLSGLTDVATEIRSSPAGSGLNVTGWANRIDALVKTLRESLDVPAPATAAGLPDDDDELCGKMEDERFHVEWSENEELKHTILFTPDELRIFVQQMAQELA